LTKIGALILVVVGSMGCLPSFDGLSGGGQRDGGVTASSDAAKKETPAPTADASIADAIASFDAVPDTSGEANTEDGATCPGSGGPTMVRVPTVDGRSFCVDSTEVTQGQYSQFLTAKKGDTSGQDPRCTWNDSYGSVCGNYDPVSHPDTPVSCVDWCDALAFCAWAGKRLCGKIGGGSLPDNDNVYNDPTQGQKYAACSHGGARIFPYGDTEDKTACNIDSVHSNGPLPAGGSPKCEGGYDGIFDMVGNLQEWEDICSESDAGAAKEMCRVRGGDFRDQGWNCRGTWPGTRDSTVDWIGFRCCSD
jgi:formylglycine-generating enzyme required for sulfatase activity